MGDRRRPASHGRLDDMNPRHAVCRPRLVVLAALALVLAVASVGLAQDVPDEAWLDLPLVDAASGEPFTVRGHTTGVVLVETMATWCSNCRRQLGHLAAAADELQGEAAAGVPVTFVVVSVERGLDPALLGAYATREGLSFRFAVADDAMLRALADRFGRVVLNPPATPHVVIAPGGAVGALSTGFVGPADLVARVRAAAE